MQCVQTDSVTFAAASTDTGDASAEAGSGSGSNVEDGGDAFVRRPLLISSAILLFLCEQY
jgi:hypothetical protein